MNRIFLAVLAAVAFGSVAAGPVSAQGGRPMAPFAGGGKPEGKDPAVEKLVAAAQKLSKQQKAKPTDAKLKAKTADAWYQAGYALEYSKAGLSSRTRYRGALAHYRTTLALDPTHKKAAFEKKQIEDIYKSMGMPVPK
jgi:hypothetical protein